MNKNNTCLVVIAFLALFLGSAILILNVNKELKPINDEKTKISDAKGLKYFDTKYSINDMYRIISSNERPDDDEFYDVILNWFNYFSEDNLFINQYGESYNFTEYQQIKNEYSDETLKILLLDANKSWFYPVLSK